MSRAPRTRRLEGFEWTLMFARSVDSELDAREIVGESPALKRALALAKSAAQTDSPCLISGEPGSGEELIAHAIHRMGPRRNASFVKVNSATPGEGLLERQLFGLEPGVFDNAIIQQTGWLELANQGTLFLKEMDRFPLDLQPKLLRVLGRREFERVGSNRPIRANVRIIAATRARMEELVSENRFRRDLFEQLNVFPISVPSLRERPHDIPLLVRHFVQRFARQLNKPIETIPAKTMNTLRSRNWPGNVRQLANFIARAVSSTEGSALQIALTEI